MHTNDEADLQRRSRERGDAVDAIERTLSKLENAGREPDPWEREALAEAIGAIFRGAYVLASVNAGLAAVEVYQRSPTHSPDPAFGSFHLAVLRRAFDEARNQPIFPHAVLGPILVGRG
jgi:hypothetical protein